jgi:hypothetical protein
MDSFFGLLLSLLAENRFFFTDTQMQPGNENFYTNQKFFFKKWYAFVRINRSTISDAVVLL